MKCSTYLWNYFTMNKEHPEYSNAQVQGELRLLLGDEKIVSDTDGAELSERDALSIYGRNDEMSGTRQRRRPSRPPRRARRRRRPPVRRSETPKTDPDP